MDFIGPLPESNGFKYILHIIEYMSRYSMTFPSQAANKEDTIQALEEIFQRFTAPVAIYADIGQHFDNKVVKDFLTKHRVTLIPSPSGASKSTGRIKKANDILQNVIKKSGEVSIGTKEFVDKRNNWSEILQHATSAIND